MSCIFCRIVAGEVKAEIVAREPGAVAFLDVSPLADGHVLVVDGDGSLRCALVGGRLAALAAENDWRGIVVHGAVRDAAELAAATTGVKALALSPRKSGKAGTGVQGAPVRFATEGASP